MQDLEEEDVVLVPVPKNQLGVVYEALARSMGEQAATEGASPSAVQAADIAQVQKQGEWTEAMVKQLEADLRHAATRTLLTMTAERAPRSVSFTEAATRAGVQTTKLRGELGALSKITKRLFGKTTWPMTVKFGERGEASYSMDPKVANWWLSAAEIHTADSK